MNESDTHRPCLRHVDVHPATQDGHSGVALSDPLGLLPSPIFVPDGLLPVVGRFDGERSIVQIEAELRAAGSEPPAGFVASIVEQFEGLTLLDGPEFQSALAEAARTFRSQDARPSPHAGRSAGYPAEPDAAREALGSMVHRPTGPRAATPRGIVAPHIDLARGREGYSMAYSALAEREPADLYVVFGTGHHGPSAPVTGLAMDWQTPLGTVRTDREFVDAIHRRLGPAHPADVFLHRDEHSIEFQMLFLAHVLEGHDFEVAGFLTGHLFSTGGAVEDEPHVRDIVDAFRQQATASNRKVCFVAGADLAHIGTDFGDPEAIDDPRLELLAATERTRLAHLERGDIAAFYRDVETPGNPDRVCGTTPIVLTALLAGVPGQLLHYGQATSEGGSQTVSFCSMLFE